LLLFLAFFVLAAVSLTFIFTSRTDRLGNPTFDDVIVVCLGVGRHNRKQMEPA